MFFKHRAALISSQTLIFLKKSLMNKKYTLSCHIPMMNSEPLNIAFTLAFYNFTV